MLRCNFRLFINLADVLGILSGGYAADGCHYLQLGSSLIDIGDAGIAHIPLDRVVLHEARTAVDLQGIVSDLVGILAGKQFLQRRVNIGKFLVFLHLGAFLLVEGTFFGNVVIRLVHVHETGSFVKDGTDTVQLRLHVRQHLVNSRELNNRLAELLALAGVFQALAVSGFSDADGLSANTQAGSVHQCHYVFNQTHLAFAHQFCRCVLEYQFAGR